MGHTYTTATARRKGTAKTTVPRVAVTGVKGGAEFPKELITVVAPALGEIIGIPAMLFRSPSGFDYHCGLAVNPPYYDIFNKFQSPSGFDYCCDLYSIYI